MTAKEFLKHLEPLKQKVEKLSVPKSDFEKGTLPFVVIIKSELVNNKAAMSFVTREGRNGIDVMRPHEPSDFKILNLS